MKRSTRLILTTILAFNGVIVLYTIIGRLSATESEPRPQRATTEELTALRDFTIVRSQGDFDLEIVQQADFSVEFSPTDTTTGSLRVYRRDNELMIMGSNNPPDSKVRIGMPVLQAVSTEYLPSISISGFTSDTLNISAEAAPQIVLRNNNVEQWRIAAGGQTEVQVDQTTMASGKVRMVGQGVISIVD